MKQGGRGGGKSSDVFVGTNALLGETLSDPPLAPLSPVSHLNSLHFNRERGGKGGVGVGRWLSNLQQKQRIVEKFWLIK